MTKQEFTAIVDDAVAAGANRTEAEQYVIAGYKLDASKYATVQSPKSKSPKAKK